ncbi:OLC1v1030418C1 [Oldenlandia corymbosa var. corymbosa]|uniref:OLC1v1030418C1 n=1 Tax=Oldenlandia corymbosa var. corymbosa TaxID=529605 RepID=A0AAV1CHW9_OLDCO|nr:OLC1v1030418C1 [Oldenlandia corymbosa var. corymbosa]
MCPSEETQELNPKPNFNKEEDVVDDESQLPFRASSQQYHHHHQENVTKKEEKEEEDGHHHHQEDKNGTNNKMMFFFPSSFKSVLLEPFEWLHMLSSRLDSTFVLGVILVYGLSQGFAQHFFKVVSDYYWKDVQKVQPSAVQLFIGLYYIPWILKPIWGLMTDVFPVRGYKRRPYFVFAGILGTVSAMVLALSGNLAIVLALLLLIGIMTGIAIADVTIDACIARKSIEIKSLAPDMQSLCMFCNSVGALLGYLFSGFFVHHLGAQGSLGLLGIPAAAMVALGFMMKESRTVNDHHHSEKKKAMENLGTAVKGMYKTIKIPDVWKPALYIFFSLAMSISTHEGQFYWFTDPKAGPAFSQEFVGMVYAIGALASIVGVLIYHKTLKDYPFRSLLFFAQLLYASAGMLDVVFVRRWNLAIGIPDYFFVITEECVSRIIARIRWMPMMVLSSRLCPLGIEGTFFALLMCIDSLGSLTAKSAGGVVLHLFHVTRTDFRNLWLVLLIRNLLRFGTLALIFLLPDSNHSSLVVSVDNTKTHKAAAVGVLGGAGDDDNLQLVPLNEKIDV